MMWERSKIKTSRGEIVEASAPVIVSASRRTDIPAFFSEWFLDRLEKGYVCCVNTFNGRKYYISFENTRLFVFWTKNPSPFIPVLDILDKRRLNYYFQFTLNDYSDEHLEEGIPPLDERIKSFRSLSSLIGKEKVIWRFDPLLVTDKLSLADLLGRVENLASELSGFTNRLVFSFADISVYKKVKRNLEKERVNYIEHTNGMMLQAAERLSEIGRRYSMEVCSCSENIDLKSFGIEHGKCIDDELIGRLFPEDQMLNDFVFGPKTAPIFPNPNYKRIRDKGQRKECNCIASKDIGTYGTCVYNCLYCYAAK